jgi:RimJ/RimL family protein N-acetyltransferase
MSMPATAIPSAGPAPMIETERLRLRPHRADDYVACMAIWSDPEVIRYIGGRPFSAEEGWRKLLQFAGLWSVLGYGYWAVEERSSGRYIGHVGCADFKRDLDPSLEGMLELGWVLASDAQGKGYASEAVAATMRWGAAHFAERRMVCIIAPENLASIRVAEKAGFRRWQETIYHDGPTIVFAR